MEYLKPTQKLIEEMGDRLQPKDRENLKLPDGVQPAVRMYRDEEGELQIVVPWRLRVFFPE